MRHLITSAFVLCLVGWISAAEPAKVNAPPEPQGMVSLFNGKDLTGWEGDPRLWSAKDGIIRGETTKENAAKGNTFLIYKGGEFGDFELRMSARLHGGNSGIQYRSRHVTEAKENQWVVAGYQAEVAGHAGADGFLYHERGRGSICLVGDKVVVDENGKKEVVGKLDDRDAIAATFKKGDWNDYIIICKGNHVMQYLNGVQTVDVIDNDPKGRCMSGIIALQIHAGGPMVTEFKDIRIKAEAAK